MSKNQSGFDNTNSGAVFSGKAEGLMSGPFQLGKRENCIAVLELGKPGSDHTLRVHERKKDLSPGKLLAEGSIKAIVGGGVPAKGGVGFTPVARGELRSKAEGDIRLVVFRQENANGSFYQLKPDSFEPRQAPPL